MYTVFMCIYPERLLFFLNQFHQETGKIILRVLLGLSKRFSWHHPLDDRGVFLPQVHSCLIPRKNATKMDAVHAMNATVLDIHLILFFSEVYFLKRGHQVSTIIACCPSNQSLKKKKLSFPTKQVKHYLWHFKGVSISNDILIDL